MQPIKFPEANSVFRAPNGLEESQVRSISAFSSQVVKGSCDGLSMVVVAWMPTEQELHDIVHGKPIFLTMVGGLAPHFLTTSFQEAINPS